MDTQSFAYAKKIVYHYLKYRPRSEKEITQKLRDKEFAEELIQQTVTYFKNIGSVNDRQFAALWVQSRLKKPFGTRRIRMELKNKGISDEMITDALQDTAEHYCEHKAITDLIRRRISHYRSFDKITTRRRLYNYLIRRGFRCEDVIKTMKEIAF